MRDVTAQEIEESMKLNNITSVGIRRCSMCNTMLTYNLLHGRPYVDTNCDCVSYTTDMKEVSFKKLADWVNCQTKDEHKLSIAKQFGIEL